MPATERDQILGIVGEPKKNNTETQPFGLDNVVVAGKSPAASPMSTTFAVVKANLGQFLESLIEIAKEEGFHVVLQGFEDDDFEQDGVNKPSMAWATVSTDSDFSGFLKAMTGKAKENGIHDFLDRCKEEDSENSASPEENTSPQKPILATPITPVAKTPETTKSPPKSPRKALGPRSPEYQSPAPAPLGSMGSLVLLMSSTSLDRSKQKVAKRIAITKAYQPSMTQPPKCHYDQLAVNKAGMNSRRFPERKRKREELGFKPDEVISKGALHTKDPEMKSTLKGKVHAIFHETHFTDVPHDVYEIIKPALLLATKFLTTPQCLQHFHTVLKGEREVCFETSFMAQSRRYRIRKTVPITQRSLKDLNKYIDSIASALTWQFWDAGVTQGEEDVYHATTKIIPCKHNRSEYLSHPGFGTSSSPQKTLISIHPDFYIEAKRLCTLKYPDSAQALRFMFFLAVNIMHEFAHAFEVAVSPAEAWNLREVFMLDSPVAESGRAWEASILGDGYCASINSRCDALFGLGLMQWPPLGLREIATTGQDEIWAIPMTYIHNTMQQSFWDELSTKSFGDQTLLHVPKTGAKSIGIVSLTTAKFEDVLKERPMAGMELALREVEGPDDEEREGKRKQGKMYVPKSWKRGIGRRGGL